MALLARGREVVMVDVGERLETDRETLRTRLAGLDPGHWAPEDVAEFKRPQLEGGDAIRRYGSDFIFRDPDGAAAPLAGSNFRPSFAYGGLSNGWGAAVLPYRQEDLTGWPIRIEDLAPHYRAVADFMPVAGGMDDLQTVFPVLDLAAMKALKPSAQAEVLLERIRRNRAALKSLGVTGGGARQAVAVDCRACGLCLHGCPYEYIFKASQVVEAMRTRPGFDYRGGLRAVAFRETGEGVSLTCRAADGATVEVTGERLFVGAGVLPTAQLTLGSIGAAGDEVELLDSQHLFLPLLHGWGTPRDPATEPRHALTQAFLEVTDPEVSPWTVHAQIYSYNEFYALDMKGRYGRLPFSGPLFEALARRLLVAQVFLHSDHSHRIGLKAGEGGRLDARLIPNPAMVAAAARARRRIAKAGAALGLLALTPTSRLGAPGSSFHVGGSFPMRREPRRLQTDALGRPAGLARTHLIDASVLPSVPATTITYSVMANAHRIAALAP